MSPPSRPGRGTLAIVTNVGTGCGGRGGVGRVSCRQGGLEVRERTQRADDRRQCVRQMRVVLTPHGWRQVLRRRSRPNRVAQPISAGRRRQTNPDRRGEHAISRQTIAQGMSGCPRLYLYARVRSFAHSCTRDRGCSEHPAFPAPSCFRANDFFKTPGASRRGIAELYLE